MLFKFFRKKIVEGIIKDFIAGLPKYQDFLLQIYNDHKEEILKKVENAIQEVVREYLEKKLGKKFY